MRDLIFVTLPRDGEDIHIRVDAILTIRPMDDPRKSFLGLSNGQYEVVDLLPLDVIEKVALTVSKAEGW